MEFIKKVFVYAILFSTLIIVGCEGGCSQDSPTSPEQSSSSN